ncbi:MAG: aldo/keto reductase [Verrucomicrobiota bacterium]
MKKTTRREFVQRSLAVSAGLSLAQGIRLEAADTPPAPGQAPASVEWRNRQEGMAYRQLGRTGMMVSELMVGSFPFNDESCYPVLDAQLECGMNYIDTAASYSNGKVEETIGTYLDDSKVRDNVFLSTKLSYFYGYIDKVLAELDKELPDSRKRELKSELSELMKARRVLKPGYHMNFFDGQENQFEKSYYRHLLLRDYGYRNGWKKKIKEHSRKLLQDSLNRLKTDHVDVLFCPHGISMPDLMEDGLVREIFEDFKQEGLIRASAVSFHNDVAANLSKAIDVGYYDVVMFAYNIANHAALESLVYKAKENGVGTIAMKVARLFKMEEQPDWRVGKLNTAIPDENLTTFAKAYLWALQNPNLSCCVSQMETPEQVADNFSIVGRQVEIQPV